MQRLLFTRCAFRGIPTLGPIARNSFRARSLNLCIRQYRNSFARPHPPQHRPSHRKSLAVETDTIYALSTAPGKAAIAVIRVTGPACLTIYEHLCPGRAHPKPRVAALRKLKSPDDAGKILDTGAVILYFPAPATVTGEDVLELHVHGGPAIVRSVLEALPQAARDGERDIRPADAGEFTKRAFYNDRIDLAEVEALGEALAAETEQQRRHAISGAESGLTQRYEEWRSTLLYARGELEALIDFSEDQHFDESPAEFMKSVGQQVVALKRRIELHIVNASRGELLRSGINVALLGAPNAGKSSLLNRIVGREAAIVSAEEGTTRDIVDVSIDMQGWLVRLGDMAGVRVGLRPADGADNHSDSKSPPSIVGEIEREGIRRARERALQSDLVIVLVSLQPTADGSVELAINDELVTAVIECCQARKDMVFALNKVDLLHSQSKGSMVSISRLLSQLIEAFPHLSPNDVFCLSCKEADSPKPDEPDSGGVQTFINGLTRKFGSMTAAAFGTMEYGDNELLSTAEAQNYWTASLNVTHRQSEFLKRCLEHLNEFLEVSASPESSVDTIQTTTVKPAERYEKSSRERATVFFDTAGSGGRGQSQIYHVDNHEDIVGEIEIEQIESSSAQNWENLPSAISGPTIATDDPEIDIVTAAEHLRCAADCLAMLTGRGDGVSSGADVEDVLGVVFEK